jgi:hypothetical protein
MVPSVFACDDLCGILFVCVTPSKSEEARFCLTIRVMFCCWCGEYTMDILQTGWRKASSFFKSTVDVFSACPPQRRTWSQTETIVIACEIEPLEQLKVMTQSSWFRSIVVSSTHCRREMDVLPPS